MCVQATQLHIAGSMYEFTYDSNRNIHTINLPSRSMYKINRILGVGFQRTEIRGFNNEKLLLIDTDDKGRRLSLTKPG